MAWVERGEHMVSPLLWYRPLRSMCDAPCPGAVNEEGDER